MATRRNELRAIISADARAFMRTMGNVRNAVGNASRVIAGMSVVAGAFSVRKFVQFEKGMAQLNTILKLNKRELDELGEGLRGVVIHYGLDMPSALKAAYDAASAGIPKGGIIDFMRVASEGAKAGMTDVATATDGIRRIINAKLVPSYRTAADGIQYAVDKATITWAEFSEFFSTVGPSAKAAGIGFRELISYISVLASVETPQKTMVALRNLIMMAAREGMQFQELLKKLQGADLISLAKVGVEARTAGALSLLLEGAIAYEGHLKGVESGVVTVRAAADKMMATAGHAFDVTKAKAVDAGVTIGEAMTPVLAEIVDKLVEISSTKDGLNDIGEGFKSILEVVLALSNAMGALIKIAGFFKPAADFVAAGAIKLGMGATEQAAAGSSGSAEIAAVRRLRAKGINLGEGKQSVYFARLLAEMQNTNSLLKTRLPESAR